MDYEKALRLAESLEDGAGSREPLASDEAMEIADQLRRIPGMVKELIYHREEAFAISRAIGAPKFMDEPDGGDVPFSEQVRRMACVNRYLTDALTRIAEQTYDEWSQGAIAGQIAAKALTDAHILNTWGIEK